MTDEPGTLRTPLHELHVAGGARMVGFSGYDMPLQFAGVIAEHRHTRSAASLFDVSHMGIVDIEGPGAAAALEELVPAALLELEPGRSRYTMLTNDAGGVRDDLMVTAAPDGLTLVVNASRKLDDIAHLREHLPASVAVRYRDDLSLLALQGPLAEAVIGRWSPAAAALAFMSSVDTDLGGHPVSVSRSGYTGEDGFEITVSAADAVAVATLLLHAAEVQPAGLGARDTLRLEAGLCLYGNDLTETTTPVEAGLTWTIGKRRRSQGGFPGADVVLAQLADGAPRRRVGIQPTGRRPVRAGAVLHDHAGRVVGVVTSGGFGPTVNAPVAMGYVQTNAAVIGTELSATTAGRDADSVRVAPLPFTPYRYHRP